MFFEDNVYVTIIIYKREQQVIDILEILNDPASVF